MKIAYIACLAMFTLAAVLSIFELWFDLHIKGKLAGNGLNSRFAQARSQAQTIAGVILLRGG